MISNKHDRLNVFLLRVMYEFYPVIGGSITHTLEEIKEIDSRVEGQIIIAPKFQIDCSKFDSVNPIQVMRIEFPIRLVPLQRFKLPVQPLIILGFAINSVKLIRILAKEKPKNLIIHVEGTLLGAMVNLLLSIQSIRIPLIITQHSANPLKTSKRESLATMLALLLLSIKKPRTILVLDDGTGIKDFGEILNRLHIKWRSIYHAFNNDFFIPSDVNHRDGFIILSTSRLDPFKRMDLALRAYSRFIEISGAVDSRFIIAGSGEELQSLKKLVRDMRIENSVDFVGDKSVDEIRELLRKASVVIGTSLKSNVNRSTQEAMCAGKAVIVFNNGAEDRLITDGYDGILVKPGDIDAFAEALKIIHENIEIGRTMGMNAKEKMLRERSWNKRIDDNLSSYREIYG